ncbi:MAG TPA: hypothetical protein GX717_05395, partial [Clostridiaceae bacterium]|nr:hypothetical protein [Clostridiaceae bacterium]
HRDQETELFDLLAVWLRDLLLSSDGRVSEHRLINFDAARPLRQLAARCREPQRSIVEALNVLSRVRMARHYNGNFEICIHYLLLQMRKELQHA